MEYQIQVDYACSELGNNAKWFLINQKTPPIPGTINQRFLPPHRCRKDEYRVCCENDPDCNKEVILKVIPVRGLPAIIYDESGFSSGFGV